MSYTITKIGGQINNSKYHEIVCHSEEDIATLPTDPDTIAWGSSALIISNSSVWLLDEDLVWKQI